MAPLFGLSGFVITVVAIVFLVITLMRKRSLKVPLIVLTTGIAFIIIAFALEEPVETETAVADQPAEEVVAPEKTEAEIKAEADAKKKAEEEKAAAEKAEADKKIVAEKDYYLKEIQPKADTQMGMYDDAWDSLWVTTFNGVGDGSVDIYTAYDNMKQLEQRYQTLQSSVPAIPSEGLSKENKKTFKEFQDQMTSAARWRASIAKKAQEMFDTGDLSPSKMDEIKSEVDMADNEMINAVVSLTSLEMELGIERE